MNFPNKQSASKKPKVVAHFFHSLFQHRLFFLFFFLRIEELQDRHGPTHSDPIIFIPHFISFFSFLSFLVCICSRPVPPTSIFLYSTQLGSAVRCSAVQGFGHFILLSLQTTFKLNCIVHGSCVPTTTTTTRESESINNCHTNNNNYKMKMKKRFSFFFSSFSLALAPPFLGLHRRSHRIISSSSTKIFLQCKLRLGWK